MVVRRLLIVGDYDSGADAIDEVASAFGLLVRRASGAAAIEAALRDFGPDAVILDPEARDGASLDTLRGIARTGASLLLLGGLDDRAMMAARAQVEAEGVQVAGMLAKPISPGGLEAALRAMAGELAFSAAEIGAAVMRGEITAWYQLQLVRAGAGWRADGAEALARWEHPEHGTVLPDAFLPVAEAAGQIAAITDCVLLNAVQQLGAWHRGALPMRVGVNLAPSLVTDPDFPERLARLLHEYDVPARSLVLEIPESGLNQASAAFIGMLARLRIHGLGLALEHFGSGISSLADLYRTPFSELKISRRLVTLLDEDEDARRLVRGIIQLARELGIGTAAEAVETQKTLDFLHAAGCDRVQGFLVSRPLPAVELQAVAERWR
jgi:EAL domain-containing protein (putative c-di-GMP-specific phosphodiesterase class I)/CheY-like chemotaxis protein